jgi:succinoglycan biosynthesis transport protein ExoP
MPFVSQDVSMLDRQLKSIIQKPAPEQGALAIDIGLRQLLGFLRRRRKVIVAVPAVVLALALAYVLTATPQYTATAALLIDTQKLSIFSQGDVVSETVITNAGLETQVQILRSGRLAEAVAKKLDLIHNEGFMAESPGLLDTLIGFVTGSSDAPAPAPDEARLTRMATSILRSNLTAMRVGLSFVINVSYTDDDPVLAARIATAYTAAYVDEQLNAQVATAQRGSEWLLSRIDELRNQTTAQNLTAQEKSAIRATYDDFLQRYTQTVQQQSLPLSEARVITTPVRGSQTSPKSLLIVAAALFGGGLIGVLVALVRDLLDQAVRTRKEIETTTRGQFLGYLPKLRTGGWIGRLSGGRRKADTGALRFRTGPAYSAGIDAPRSQFTETLRNVRLALDKASPPGQGVVCGIVSAVPKEGRSTVAINFARLVAQSGRRVLLIDGDMRSGALSRAMVPAKAPGLVHLANGEVQLADLIWSDDATRLHLTPPVPTPIPSTRTRC